MIVACAICGYVTEVKPRAAALHGTRLIRNVPNPPNLWICDIHFNPNKESLR